MSDTNDVGYVVVRGFRRDKTNVDIVTAKTEVVHIDGAPFLWLIELVLELAPNLRVLQVTPGQMRHLHSDSHLKRLAERGVVVRDGYHLVRKGPRGASRSYQVDRQALHALAGEPKRLFDELIAFGFEDALLTSRYFCLNGEEYLPYHKLREEFGYGTDSVASSHVLSVLNYVGVAPIKGVRAVQLSRNLHARVELRRRRLGQQEIDLKEHEWKTKILTDLGLDRMPDGLSISKLPLFGQVLEATRAGRFGELSEREQAILKMRYGLEKLPSIGCCQTLLAIGEHMGVSRERIRQLEEVALDKLGIDEEAYGVF